MKKVRTPSLGVGAIGLLVILTAILATGVAAENSGSQTAPPAAFITINPEAGLPLDPFLISVQGGGPVAANTLAKECKGYIPANPTVSVDYKGKADSMTVFFKSDGDPVLVVRTPDGKIVCNDDLNPAVLDPLFVVSKPAKGRYDLWVGSSAPRDLIPGFLVFTTRGNVNLGTFSLANLVKRPAESAVVPDRPRLQNAAKRIQEALAAIKTAEPLQPGGGPLTKTITVTGELPVPELATGPTLCAGLVNLAPDMVVDWSGEAKALGVMFEGDGDSTLLVRAPDGSMACADDASGPENLNPLVIIAKPAAGRYMIWVGRVDPTKTVSGTLTVASTGDIKPKVLAKRKP
jgi:hypothetical protein